MLKKICILFLGLVVFTGSACVTPTHASSAQNIIITRVQTGGSPGAKEELIVLYNPSSQSVDITNWCLKNKADIAFACFASSRKMPLLYSVPPHEYVTVASDEYVTARSYNKAFYSLVYSVTDQSSGSIVAGSDSIRLVNTASDTIDSLLWSDTKTTPPSWRRLLLFPEPDTYSMMGSLSDWKREANSDPPVGIIAREDASLYEDEDENEDVSPDEPEDTTSNGGTLKLPPAANEQSFVWPYITELLPNPSGTDAGHEFIELFNPNSYSLPLEKFSFQVGTTKPKDYALPAEVILPANGYVVLYNVGLMNFTLSNTAGRVQLLYDGVAVGEAIDYETAKDNKAWALVDDAWIYTAVLTPGQPNRSLEEIQQAAAVASTTKVTTQKPCAANQYRNPATGRCKLLSAATSTLTPCKVGQERNPETNRCRTIKAATTPTPCKEGYERNPETNRCRKVKSMTTAGYGVAGVQGAHDNRVQWYYWLGIIGVVVAILAYGVWEWRVELRAMLDKLSRGILNRQN